MYVQIQFPNLGLTSWPGCSDVSLKIKSLATNETHVYCHSDNSKPIPRTILSDAIITFSHTYYGSGYVSSFRLKYHTEDLVCAQKNHFRCSNHKCIHDSKVCDRVKDCENGRDEIGCEKGILAMKGVDEGRVNTISWLLKNRESFGWGRNTPRSVTALYLAHGATFNGRNLEDDLMAKQLELQISVALLRNSTDPISLGELSMYVNALSVTCHNPREFYGYDLVEILSERASMSKSPSPGTYLTLCNSNWTLSETEIGNLVQILRKNSKYPFALDVQAMTVMALTCVKKSQGNESTTILEESDIYNATIEKFISSQRADGSFGNIYTTALVTQALVATEQMDNPKWNVSFTVRYLLEQLNSNSIDFLSAYLTLPVLGGGSLVDVAARDCSNITRKQNQNNEISDVTNKLGAKMRVQYSLFVGDQKDVVHTISLRVPEQISAYDIMRVAQVADPKYKFRYGYVSGHMYVYEIAGIINDPEPGHFWLMYSRHSSGTTKHLTESPDKYIVGDKEHLIMWYKTAHL